ncbi:MAG TPA: thrombospondin type 3 repeat-containing protein, partial [Myxococcota bacterium]|nr:thrombospondin type 3 repeat-containing protein [Myxococcota bacterium]
PWRYSFDRGTGDLYIGDVGQDHYEEVDYVPAASRAAPPAGGFNFGWNICEGFHDYLGNCAASNTTKPVIEYAHDASGGDAVTGGYVYRGNRLPGLFGAYVYADFVDGNLWTWNGALPAQPALVASVPASPSSFGEDRDGELYITAFDGRIYTLVYNTTPPSPFPANLSGTGLFANTATLTPAPGLVEYDVNAPLWSDGALKRRWVALPAGQTVHFQADGAFDFPVGTALVKHFEIQTSPTTTRRLETRVFLRQIDRWTGFTYRWNTAQTDATLLNDAASDTLTITSGGTQQTQVWNYPSPAQCLVCHSAPEKRVLGPRALQLNKSFSYPSGADNQLHAWTCMGMFDRAPQSQYAYGAYASIGDTTKSVQLRARAYLASNCSICHQPLGTAPGSMDFRYTRLLGELNAIGVAPTEGTLGLANAQRIHVGVPEQSVLFVRQQSSDPSIRMPKNSQVPDTSAVSVFDPWIRTTLAAAIDSDEDGIPDATDNCPRIANAPQSDTGGFGTTTPDGIGSACQCGDANSDGKVDAADIMAVRKAMAKLFPLSGNANRRCESPSDTGECSVVSWARIAKGLSGASAAHGQSCAAATELGP